MNTQDKEHLIKKYFTARYIVDKCITRYEIFLQSVQIAVEQVQSIEIRCLEEKIEAQASDVLTDIMMLFLIEGKFASALFKPVSKAAAKYLKTLTETTALNKYFTANVIRNMSSERLKKIISTTKTGTEELEVTISNLEKLTTDALQTASKVGEKKLYGTKASTRNSMPSHFQNGVRNWVNEYNDLMVRPVINGKENDSIYYKGLSPNVAKEFPFHDGGDTVSVTILRNAFSNYSKYKISNNALLSVIFEEIMLMSVSDDVIGMTDLVKILDEIINTDEDNAKDIPGVEYEDITTYYSFEIEKIIWIALYGAKIDMVSNRRYGGDPLADAGIIKGVDTSDKLSLQNYWWARFFNPETGMPFPTKYQLFDHFKEIYKYLTELGIEQALGTILDKMG